MDAAPSPVSTEVTTAMTPGVARALVRIHRVGMRVVAAADRNHEDELAEATGMFVLAFRNYRAKVDVGGERSVTLALSADQHAALAEVKRCGNRLMDVLADRYSRRALSIAHFELVRALDTWRKAMKSPPPVFRGANSLRFD